MKEKSHVSWKPGTLIYPLPAALVSCGKTPDDFNVLTISCVSISEELYAYGYSL